MTKALLGVAAMFIAAASFAQTQPLSERIDVNAVLLDAVVTDNRGNQILGLTKDDFIVTEDGVRQTIDSVDYFSNRKLLSSDDETAPPNVQEVREERYFVFFLDKPEGGAFFEELARARRAISEFINRDMGRDDLVAIAGHDVRLKIYSDFTSNKQQLQRALADAAGYSRGLTKGNAAGPSILRELNASRIISETGTVYEALEALADAVRPIRARKNLVVFSAGIHEPSEQLMGGMPLNESRFYKPMINALNASNVTVYASNLLTSPGTEPVFHQTLQRITSETNGEYFQHAVSHSPVFQAVEKASGGYYLITYRSRKPQGQRGFQKVNVSVVNPEFRVKARAGYTYGD